ncbi:MAG: protein kinase [Planctomycetota bacterium]
MADLDSSKQAAHIDWEAFYADYRKPDFVPGYEILNKLGAGAFGLVFKARKQSIGKDYAIKFLKVDDAAVRDAVLHELDTVRLFAQIDHPNLVSIEDMGHVGGIPYIVMGYAGEDTLARRLQDGGLPRAEALRVFLQICRGVQALHERMLVHFDLKPANVYLRGDTARVGDYGLSKLVTASRRSLSFGRGTTYYMAPEVLRRQGDHRSDIYSLGVLLYECLVGHVPFRGETEWEILKKHETETPDFPASLTATDRAVLEACLHKDPDQRVQSVADIIAALRTPEGTPIGASRPAIADRPAPLPLAATGEPASSRRPRRHGAPAMVLLAVAAIVALGLMYLKAARVGKLRFVESTRATIAEAGAHAGPGRAQARRSTRTAEAQAAATAEMRDFRERLDGAIAALQRLRDVDVRMPEVRSKAMTALGATLRNLDLKALRGQDPWTEAIMQAVKAGLQHAEVRDRWGELFDVILPGQTGR